MTEQIRGVRTRLVRIPLRRPWGPEVRDIRVIEVVVTASDGERGFGFSWTPSIGATAVQALIGTDLATFAIGRPAGLDRWRSEGWDAAWRHLHEAGGSGITTIALAGLDLALWDLGARRRGLGLPELLGRRHERQPAYGSGVNLHYSDEELVAQVERWVAAGFEAVKIKVGRPELEDDVRRVAAVRAVLGPERRLMIDANQRWTLDRATRAVEALAPFGIDWLEEPFRAEELAEHAELKRRTGVRLAVGENLHTARRFREFIEAGAVDVVQPNLVRVGGITPFLRIAELAREAGVVLAPHLLPELSAQLAFALPEETWVEDVEDAGFEELGALAAPSGVVIARGTASGGPKAGLGIRFG